MSDGVLYVEVLPSTRGIGRGITKDLDQSLGQSEKRSQSFFGKFAKWGTLAVAGIAAGVAAISLKGGISRALNIEDAQAKLKGLGHDTKAVEAIMTDALASVKGTAFGLDTAATVAATAVAAGIKPGQQLEKYLRLTADAATIAGISMEEMGSILNKTTTAGKVYTQELNQLADRGLPVFQWLQDEYGVTAEELRKMVSAGKVDAETFRKVIEENIGGAALASGDTTRGAFANMMAAFSRLGAMFAGPGLGAAKAFFGEVTELVDGVAERIRPLADGFADMLSGIDLSGMAESILGFFDGLNIGALISGAIQSRGNFIEVGFRIIQSLLEGLIGATPMIIQGASDLLTRILNLIVDYAPSLLESAVTLFSGLVGALISVLPELLQTIIDMIPTIAQTVVSLVPLLVEAAVQLFMALVEAIPTIIPILVEAITGLVGNLAATVIALIPVLIEGAIQLFLALVDAIPKIIPMLIEAVIGLVPVIIEALVSMIPALINGAVQLLLAIVKAAPKIIPDLIIAVINLVPVIIEALADMIPVLIDGAVTLFESLVKAVPIIVPQLLDALGRMGPKIVDAIVKIGPKMLDAGKKLIGKLIEGVRSMFGAIGNAFGDIMSFIGGFFPHSPAKWGPFSGAGWTQLAESGSAILDEFVSGLSRDLPMVQARLDHSLSIPAGLIGSSVPDMGGLRDLVVVDADRQLIGRMRVEAGSVVSRVLPSAGQVRSVYPY